jgi:hypothetical protein
LVEVGPVVAATAMEVAGWALVVAVWVEVG